MLIPYLRLNIETWFGKLRKNIQNNFLYKFKSSNSHLNLQNRNYWAKSFNWYLVVFLKNMVLLKREYNCSFYCIFHGQRGTSLNWLEEASCWFQNHSFQRSRVHDSDFHNKVVLEKDFRCGRGYVKFFGITYYFLQANHMSENLNLKMTQITCTSSSPFLKGLYVFQFSCVVLICIVL